MLTIKDESVLKIINKMKENGFSAYVVGGAVRNSLLGINVTDYDIVTNALPKETQSVFNKTIPTGIKHGTITVIEDGKHYEVTTMRTEGAYTDLRHPDEVNFVRNLEEDLKRRDFTVNAMAYDLENNNIVDLFKGQEDLKKRIIRTVGNPDERFKEDALRILRAVRFATQYAFNIEPNTFSAMIRNSHLLKNVSKERIFQELMKILLSEVPSLGVSIMLYTGILKEILPELIPMAGFNQFSSYHDKDVFWHTMGVLDNSDRNPILRLAALFHDSGKPHTYSMDEDGKGHFYGHEDVSVKIADEALKRLRCDNKTRHLVLKIIEKHMVPLDINKDYKIKNLIKYIEKENMHYFFKFKEADFAGKPMEKYVKEKFQTLKNKVDSIIDNEEPLEVKDLKITGDDLKAMGIQGKNIGLILDELLDEVLKNKDLNKRSHLFNMIERIRSRDNI